MRNAMVLTLLLVASVAGVCLAGNNTTGEGPNPPIAGKTGPNTPDNSYANSYGYTNTVVTNND